MTHRFASARASYLFQTVYFDPFNAVLYDPLPASSSYLAAALLPPSAGPASVFAALPPSSASGGLASLMFDVVGATARWVAGWRLLASTGPSAAAANRLFVPT